VFGVDDQVTAGAQPEARAGELDVRAAAVWTPGREVIQSRVDIEPDSPPIRHTHPGEEIISVLEGSLEYQIDGQPTKVYNAGEALTVPAGVIHAVRNVGTGTGTGAALATDVVQKGKPLLTLAQ
jgi:quercetin dioxygenase-like cupin family protein